jgi:hypothetical protein
LCTTCTRSYIWEVGHSYKPSRTSGWSTTGEDNLASCDVCHMHGALVFSNPCLHHIALLRFGLRVFDLNTSDALATGRTSLSLNGCSCLPQALGSTFLPTARARCG